MLKISNKLTIKCSVLLAIASYSNNVSAQDILPAPPTPQAAQFLRYGEIPVGHTTGVPQIEIPIYTISTGLIDIPISISYHASGFKVNDVASPVGLGWVLNANGWLISRIVQGIPDYHPNYKEYRLDSDKTIRTPEDLGKVKNGQKKIDGVDFSNKNNAEKWHTYFIKNGSWPLCDVRSDRYFYSLPGHMGSAQYSADNMDIGLQTIPYEPLVFSYDVSKETHTITDTKGIKYTFAKQDIFSDGRDSFISGWYLTKIQFPGQTDEVIFSYKDGKKYTIQNHVQTDTYYNRYEVEQRSNAMGCVDPYQPIHSVHATSYTTTPVLLTEIKWKNTVVKFTYVADRNEITSERLTQINVYSKTGNNEVCIKQVKFNNNNYFGTKKENHRLKLSGIEYTYSGEKYSFGYDESKNNNLPNYYVYENSPYSTEDYWGYWNGTSSNYWVFPKAVADYYNKSYKPSEQIKSIDKDPSLEHTKACVLTDIVYPTKGKTHFEYELNVGDFNSTRIKTKDGKLGGLRVSLITNYDNGITIGTKEYEYTGNSIYSEYGKNGEFRFENLFFYSKPFVDFYTLTTPAGGDAAAQLIYPSTYISTPLQCFFDASKSPVFYNEVTEYNGTKSINNGWTVYHYKKTSEIASTTPYNYSGEQELLVFVKSVDCDFGYDKGALTKQIIYDKNGKKQYEKSINYSNYAKTMKTGVRMDLYLDVEDSGVGGSLTRIIQHERCFNSFPSSGMGIYAGVILKNIIAVQTYAYQTISEPIGESECWYDDNGNTLKKGITYEYQQKSDGLPIITKPIKISVTNSNNLKYEDSYTYSYRYTWGAYKDMNAQNMLEYLIKTEKRVDGGITEYTETNYKKIGQLYLPYYLIIDSAQHIQYINYDSRGNLNYAIKNDLQKVVTLYSYNYTYPVFIVEGATLDQVVKVLTKNGFSSVEQFEAAIPSDEQIESIGKLLRNNLSSAMVSTYTYKLNVGVTSTTDCRGYKTIYEYDAAGRLINVWEQNGSSKNLLNNYKYNYSTINNQ